MRRFKKDERVFVFRSTKNTHRLYRRCAHQNHKAMVETGSRPHDFREGCKEKFPASLPGVPKSVRFGPTSKSGHHMSAKKGRPGVFRIHRSSGHPTSDAFASACYSAPVSSLVFVYRSLSQSPGGLMRFGMFKSKPSNDTSLWLGFLKNVKMRPRRNKVLGT